VLSTGTRRGSRSLDFWRACLLAALGWLHATFAASPATLTTAIPQQSLETALEEFGHLSGVGVAWPPDVDIHSLHTNGARAGLAPEDALRELVRGTGLTFTFVGERTVTIQRQPQSSTETPNDAPALETEEVVVQSTRWERQLTRQPVDVRLLDPQTLEELGIKGLPDIGALIPGVDFGFFSSVGAGVYTDIIIRGVTDRHGSSTALFFDDIPLPAAHSNTFGRALTPYFDLKGIEILPGPQGPLLGANTQGGAVRFLPRQPDLESFGGLARAEWATTNRGGPSYEAGAALGGPLVPGVLGYRLSAWYRSDGGYVSLVNPFQCTPSACTVLNPNANSLTNENFRGALTYRVAEVEITPALDYTSARSGDSPSFFTYLSNPGAGRLYNGSLIPQPFSDSFYLASVKVGAGLGWAELDSVSAYYDREGDLTVDDTESSKWGYPKTGWGNPLGPAYPVSYDNLVTTYARLRQSMFSQELRLVSPIRAEGVTWNAGVAYVNTHDTEAYRVVGQYVPIVGGPLDLPGSTTTIENRFALYGQLAETLGRITVRAALRLEHDQYQASSPPPLTFNGSGHATLAIPAFSAFYQADADRLYYVSTSKGYSPPGVDAALPTCFETASPYPTDTIWSYELGAKFGLHAEEPYLDATLFSAHWDNGPAVTSNCLVTHIPGTAMSRGLELRAGMPLREVQASVELIYIDARYTETLTDDTGERLVNDGDALGTPPLVAAPWNVLTSLARSFSLPGGYRATLRADDVFHSHNSGSFYTGITGPYYAPGLQADPATNMLNLRGTLSLLRSVQASRSARLDVSLFLSNVFDAQPTLLKRNKGVDVSTLYYATTFRPRTVGLTGTWQF
jgi:outer membrane receptor protein involved in Fe transport